jgi:excisionase family DNA binding protein
MTKQENLGQIFFTGITVNDLLLQIEQVIDAKLSVAPKPQENQSGYYSRKEVAKLLKITLPTLHDWTKQGLLKSYKIGTRVLYKPLEVKDALEKSISFKHKKGGYRHA